MGRMNNETTVARLILGTMSYGTTIDQDRAFALMDRFVAAGGVWLDTADCYAFWDDPSGVGGASGGADTLLVGVPGGLGAGD